MTGAATVVWFLGRKRDARKSDEGGGVSLDKPESRTEAERAVRESAERQQEATGQRGVVSKLVYSLAEVRKDNHFAEGIRTAMLGGDRQ